MFLLLFSSKGKGTRFFFCCLTQQKKLGAGRTKRAKLGGGNKKTKKRWPGFLFLPLLFSFLLSFAFAFQQKKQG